MITIYVGKDPILNVEVDDKSYRYRKLQSADQLVLYFALDHYVRIPVGAYAVYQNERFELMTPSALKMVHTRNYEYTLTMFAAMAKLENIFFRDPVDGRISFSYTAQPREHLEKLVANMGAGWSIGDCISSVKKVVNYDYMTCREALEAMAKAFDTEFEVDNAGGRNVVSLKKVEYNKSNPLDLSYGKGMGFRPNIVRNSSSVPVDVLVLQTSDRNIDYTKYGFKSLRLPREGAALYYNGAEFSNSARSGYRKYVVGADRLSIRRGDREETTGAEACLNATDIYPTVTHVVSWVDPENPCRFSVNRTPEVNYRQYRIAGEVMTLVFQSGEMAGREFDIVSTAAELTGYDPATATFRIVPEAEAGLDIPNATLRPAVGDTLKVFHCALPDEYICNDRERSGASWELFKAAIEKLYDEEDQKYTISGDLDPIFARADWVNIGGKIIIGGHVRYAGEMMDGGEAIVRIIGVKDYVNNPHAPVIELSNDEVSSHVSAAIKQIDSNSKVSIERTGSEAMKFARRRWEDVQSTIAMLEVAIEGFDPSIRPVSLQTLLALVGDESMQFQFENWRGSVVNPSLSFDPYTKKFSASIGSNYLHHLTLKNDVLSSGSKGLYKWRLNDYESAVLDDPDKAYYLYAKCLETGSIVTDDSRSTFVLSETAHQLKEDGYYYFMIGVLLPEQEDGGRNFNPLYGYTQIAGGRITTSRVEDASGDCFFDLDSGSFAIGDSSKYVRWNYNGDGTLAIKGAINVAGDGTVTPVLNPKGEYSDTETYYYGDLITYAGDQYFSVSRLTIQGHNPIDYPDDWKFYSAGARRILSESAVYGCSSGMDVYPTDWKDTPEEVVLTDETPYFWTKTVFYYSDGSYSSPIYSVSPRGEKGADGQNGADGKDGQDGRDGIDGHDGQASFKSIVFKRTNAASVPAPSDSLGSFFKPVPVGWSDGVPDGEARLWMCTRIFTSDGLAPQGSWTTPQPATDTADIDFEYSAVENAVNPDTDPAGTWHDGAAATSADLWMAMRKCKNGVWGSWAIFRIKGERGINGSSIIYEYAKSPLSTVPTTGWQYKPFSAEEMKGMYAWEHQIVFDEGLQPHVLDGSYEYPAGSSIYPDTVRLIHDPAAEAEEKAARDDMAKTLGYANWEDFEAKIAQGEVVIDGGYLRANLIDTEALVATLLSTGMAGRRIVLTGDDVTIYKEDNTPAIHIGGSQTFYSIDNFVDDGAAPSVVTYAANKSGNINLWAFGDHANVSFGWTADGYLEFGDEFTLSHLCRVGGTAPVFSLFANSMAGLVASNVALFVDLFFINQVTGQACRVAKAEFRTLSGGAVRATGEFQTRTLDAGRYKAALALSGGFDYISEASDTRTLTFGLAETFRPQLTVINQRTEVFANGFGYKLDEDNYHVTLADATGVEWNVQAGTAAAKYGLKVTKNMLQGVAGDSQYHGIMLIDLAAYFTTTSSGMTKTSETTQTGNSIKSFERTGVGTYTVTFNKNIGGFPVLVTPYKVNNCAVRLSSKTTTSITVKAENLSENATELSGFSIMIIKTS